MKKTFKRGMVRLRCDIELGGSTTQYLEWADRNISSSDFVDSLKKQLQYKAKTKPALMAKRSAVLVSLFELLALLLLRKCLENLSLRQRPTVTCKTK